MPRPSDRDPNRDYDLEAKDAQTDHDQCSKANLQAQAVVTANALRNLAAVTEYRSPAESVALRQHADDLEKAVIESNRKLRTGPEMEESKFEQARRRGR